MRNILFFTLFFTTLFLSCSDNKDESVYIQVDKTEFSFSEENPEPQNLSIKARGSWIIDFDESSWISLSAKKGKGDQVIEITAKSNQTPQDQSITLTLKSTDGNVEDVLITIKQKGLVITAIVVDKTEITFDNKAEEPQEFTIKTNGSWVIESDETAWITLSATKGKGEQTIKITAKPNETKEAKELKLVVKSTDIDSESEVVIKQDGQENALIEVDKTEIIFEPEAKEPQELKIKTTALWIIEYDDASWITLDKKQGKGDYTLQVTTKPNPSVIDREMTITILSANEKDEDIKVTIKQKGQIDYPIELDNNEFELTSDWQYVNLNIKTKGKWVLEEYDSWIVPTYTEGEGDKANGFRVNDNPYSYFREGSFVIRSPYEDSKYSIKVQIKQKELGLITWELSDDKKTLIFSGKGDLTKVYQSKWSEFRFDVTSVIINDGITGIGYGVFENIIQLESISIPNSVTYIGPHVFSECRRLNNVVLPNSLTKIEYRTFSGCYALTNIKITSRVTSIGESAFQNTPLSNIELPNSVTTIGDYAFEACHNLTSVTLGNSLVSIGKEAFRDSYIKGLIIPPSVKFIGNDAFKNAEIISNPNNL